MKKRGKTRKKMLMISEVKKESLKISEEEENKPIDN